MRRTLREYGLEGAVRKFGVWLKSDDLGLTGKLDLLLEMATEAAIVEFQANLWGGRTEPPAPARRLFVVNRSGDG
jgi:hypothetical protein